MQDQQRFNRIFERSDPGLTLDPAHVHGFEEALQTALERLWNCGWQPGEVVRTVRRQRGELQESLVSHAIAADYGECDDTTLHPAWRAHVAALHLPRVAGVHGWFLPWTRMHRIWPPERRLIENLPWALNTFKALPRVIPPPGSPEACTVDLTTPVDDPMLQRIRALLAQAESTTFDAEAETFTAKAQELMTRHAISDAMLDARHHSFTEPVTLRIPIDEPYLSQKTTLAATVAGNTRCRCVVLQGLAMVAIVGMPSDTAAVDMLYTSLLVQATAALQQRVASVPSGAPERSRKFRASFWYGYAVRIGERLKAINDYVAREATAEHGDSLLPVLTARDKLVDTALNAWFPHLGRGRAAATGGDPAGWATGSASADRANIGGGSMRTPLAALSAPTSRIPT